MPDPLLLEWECRIAVPRARLWHFVADTERINRLAGIFKVHYEYEPLPTGGSRVLARGRAGGLTLRWVEQPCEWVEPEHFVFTRDFQAGPLRRLVSRLDLVDGEEPGTTHVRQRTELTPRGPVAALGLRLGGAAALRRGFQQAYALAEGWARGEDLPAIGSEPPAAGPRHRALVEEKLARAVRRAGDGPAALRLREHLLGQPQSELVDLAPYVLAARWGVDRRHLLRLFLWATREGLFDLHWRILCPSCRRAKETFASLAAVPSGGHCASCNIDFGLDFDRAIEVTFSPAPIGLGQERVDYCHFDPVNTPHRLASRRLEPGARTTLSARAAPGRYQLASPQSRGAVFFELAEDDALPAAAEVELTADGVAGLPPRLRAGRLELTVQSRCPVPAQVYLVRTAWADTAVTAAEVTALQEFRDLFSSEVLSPGAELSVRSLVFLFSDLVDSTSMYERIGDAPALRLVRAHFELLREIYTRHEGALVKTIGDAVMAVFRDPARGLAAAIEMHERIGVRDPATGVRLALRIGLHGGPCLAIEANGTVDYFGTTVNTAARVQGAAGPREVAVSAALLESEEVKAALAARAGAVRQETLRLKGLSGSFVLHKLLVEAAEQAA